MRELDIGEVSRHTGLPPSTLRYYETMGLISPIGRQGLRRQFSERVLDQLALIALGRTAGFTLDEIANMLGAKGEPEIDRQQLQEKAKDLDRTIKRLVAMRDGLRHAAKCPAPSYMECPTFRRLLRAAGTGRLRPLNTSRKGLA